MRTRPTAPADLVFEPFCGSGTPPIAAKRTGRRCYAAELDPAYCDVVVRRWTRVVTLLRC